MEKINFKNAEIASGKVIKPLHMLDLNNKKHCNVMVDVNFAPRRSITQAEMDATVFLITWDDGSQGHYQLVDVNRFPLANCFSCLTLPSHGMDYYDFYNWFKGLHPGVNADTLMAGYFYKKMN